MDTNNCSITIRIADGEFTESGISFDQATELRWKYEKNLINTGWLWVQHGYYAGETLRNVWFNETTCQQASIVIQCGSMTYPN